MTAKPLDLYAAAKYYHIRIKVCVDTITPGLEGHPIAIQMLETAIRDNGEAAWKIGLRQGLEIGRAQGSGKIPMDSPAVQE